ncbi:MAG: hypothetical protein MK066_04615 [Crocinitomicaceae bacterium]|nr:hypothetical protein [Crocinitomicaceae bacterium]
MSKTDIEFKILTDHSRLEELHKLVHDSFVESGHAKPRANKTIDLYPHLNKIEETIIVIAEINGKIVATNSATIDNKRGLHTDTFFKQETDELREKYNDLGSSWRIVTHKDFRSNIRLIIDLIKFTLVQGEKMGMKNCLFLFQKKHTKVYERIIGAKPIAEKKLNMEKSSKFETTMVLMFASLEQIRKSLTNNTKTHDGKNLLTRNGIKTAVYSNQKV